MSWAIASAVSDLPDPDSPTMPTTSPRRIENDTPRTGSIGPAAPGKVTRRSRTSSTVSAGAAASVSDACPEPVEGSPTASPATSPGRGCGCTRAIFATMPVEPMPSERAAASPVRLNARPAMTIAMPGASAASGLT